MIQVGLAHAQVLAAIHTTAFPPSQRWDAAEMAALLAMPGAFGFIDADGGFILARLAGGEAEILTLAVAPALRRQGRARALLDRVLIQTGDSPVFLEVAADNAAAGSLYAAAGFVACGRRCDYYAVGRDAVVLRR